MILNDPFLYKNIKFKATWWVGDKETDIIKEFIKQLQNLLEKLEIPANKVFFFGSSAGGFASLQQATCLEGSTAIIDIAQTNLFKFEQQQELNFLSTQLFGCRISELEPKFKYRFNAIERIKIENKKNKYIYSSKYGRYTSFTTTFYSIGKSFKKSKSMQIQILNLRNDSSNQRWSYSFIATKYSRIIK